MTDVPEWMKCAVQEIAEIAPSQYLINPFFSYTICVILKHAPKQLQWNPANEPPDDDRQIIFRTMYNGILQGHFNVEKNHFVDLYTMSPHCTVTHWMEKPALLPKGVE